MDVRPTLGEQGRIVELRVELPRLRPGPPPERLEVEGAGIEILSTRLSGTRGAETVWSVRARPTGEPGRVLLVLRAVYEGGESVEVDGFFTIVPAPDEGGFPVAPVAGGAALALLLAAGLVLAARRRSA